MKNCLSGLLLTMFLAAFSFTFADTIQIGTGTRTTDRFPIQAGSNYSYTQQIYPRAQINRAGSIERIRFYYTGGAVNNSRDWVIYMGHTNRSTFDGAVSWVAVSGMTMVYSGDVSSQLPAVDNWMEITLDTPFNYNNIDNLVIAVDENTAGSGSMYWGSYETGASGNNTCINYHSNTDNPNPASPPMSLARFNICNRIQLSFTDTVAPSAPTLISPAHNSSMIPVWEELVWSAGTGAGDARSYDLYLDTVNGSTLVLSDFSGTSYAPDLAHSSTYYWKVVAKNPVGDSPPSAVRSFSTMPDNTIYPDPDTPWLEAFGTTSSDWPPSGWSQLTGLYGTSPIAGTQWVQDDWLNQASPVNKSARINLWGGSRAGWLVSPPIGIPGDGYELSFDLGLTLFDSTSPIDPTASLDERLLVIVSDTPIMRESTILREWNNTGSQYVFNDIPHTGASFSIPLEGISGTKYFAFLGMSTVAGGSMDLFVDNVKVSEIYIPLAGSTYEYPYPVSLPLVDFAGDTSLYGDDYNSDWVSPTNNYLQGDDMVLQFTLEQSSMLSGTLVASTGNSIGMLIVNSAPNPVNPPPVLAAAISGSSTTAILANTILEAGTYSILISTWPNPQSVSFLLNLNAVPYVLASPGAPILQFPAHNATDIPRAGFELVWAQDPAGGTPHYYALYMSMDPANLENDYYFEVPNTSFDPVVQGYMSFDYSQRWYWTVEAINDEGSALQQEPSSFVIRDTPPPITSFPWSEDFEDSVFPPDDWFVYNDDPNPISWSRTTLRNYSPEGTASAYHRYDGSNNASGWLVTPAFQIPPRGTYFLNFWRSNAFPTYCQYNGVWIGSSNDPNHTSWTEIWTADAGSTDWVNTEISLDPYLGSTVRFAFVYNGHDADNWFLDDISVYNAFPDDLPPTITHLPLLNSPFADDPYRVEAQIMDDTTHNSPIVLAELYYSTDLGVSWAAAIPMIQSEDSYHADIPAQPMGTILKYYIYTEDCEGNSAQSDTYAFEIADPTWLRYSQSVDNYVSYNAGFGPTILYRNPYYGSGLSMRLLATDTTALYATDADLVIYSYDGTTSIPIYTEQVSFPAASLTVFDLSNQLVMIDTPYFFIAYENLPTSKPLLFDHYSNYQQSYVKIGDELFQVYGGDWVIGAMVTGTVYQETGSPVVSISLNDAAVPVLSWLPIADAYAYKVWGASDPYATQWTELAIVHDNSYTHYSRDDMSFFKVTADDGIISAPAEGIPLDIRSLRAISEVEHRPQIVPIK